MVARLDKGPPGHELDTIKATAWFGSKENANAPQNARNGRTIYWHDIPARMAQGFFRCSQSSFTLTAHPEVVITRINAIIPSAFWIKFSVALGPGVALVWFIELLQIDTAANVVKFMTEQLCS